MSYEKEFELHESQLFDDYGAKRLQRSFLPDNIPFKNN